jgi:putative DNA primase/helicase
MGSLAFTAAARAVWSVVKDSNDAKRRLLLPAKLNAGQEPDGLAYRIVEGHVTWEPEPVRMHADDAFAAETTALNGRGRSQARQEAAEWLRTKLVGEPVLSGKLIEEATEFGINERTLRRAFKDLGGQSTPAEPHRSSVPSHTQALHAAQGHRRSGDQEI